MSDLLSSYQTEQGIGPYEAGGTMLDRLERVIPEAGAHTLSPHQHSTILTPKLQLVSWGPVPYWTEVNTFGKDLMEGGYLSKLAGYGSGPGVYLGQVQSGGAPPASVTDATMQAFLNWAIGALKLPQPDGRTIYAALLPDGTTVQAMNGSSCANFCGYHGALGQGSYYAVIPSPSCAPCHGPNSPLQALCMVLAHEIAETCTDAVPGQGWMEDSTGMENADICAWQPVSYGPWTVQPYWTNEEGCTYGPYQQQGPPPPPGTDLEARVAELERWRAALKGAMG